MRFKVLSRLLGPVAALVLIPVAPAAAQTATTGAISGNVSDESGGVIPGASVAAIHQPTGTRYSDVTGSDGRFILLNVRVGGPYTVSVSLSGFKAQDQANVQVGLGEERNLAFRLKLDTVTEVIEVTAEGSSIISPSATGPASNVGQEAIQNLPTLARGIEDFARLSPYFNSSGAGDGSGANALSVAGRNTRYNNIQIDGAVNNDLFGLADSGTPGGQTEMQPVSLDAVQELQLIVAPYDVRQGGFSGGGVNAITRSGTNKYHGTLYGFSRSESLVGDGPSERPIATFSNRQFGASISGPIIKDKAFFFLNADFGRRDTPTGFSIDGSSGQAFGRDAEAQRFLSILRSRYNYDPGPTSEFIRGTNNNKFFGRLDFNLSDRHRLTLRHNLPKGDSDIGFPSNRLFIFADSFYEIRDTTNSSVAQLNSTFGGSAVNELRFTLQSVRDKRDGPTRFPLVTVDISGGGQLRAGRENFSTANELDQDILEITDDFTIRKGNHLITLGTHNEFFKFRNLFIRDNFGSYRFSSLDNLEAGLAQSYDLSFSSTSDPQQAARFKVNQFGFYAGDLWRVTPHLTLNYGVRLDIPSFPDKPTANPAAVQSFGFATDVAPASTMFSPRAGFNWSFGQAGAGSQLRGGLGMFSGRTPYVWLSNQYGNTGVEFRRIGASFNANNRIPFVADPNNQPRVVVGAAGFTNEIDVVDPDYKFPQLLRTNLGYDRELGVWALVGTVEVFYSKSLKDIAYANLNLTQTGTRPDGRPVFTRSNRTFSDVILLKNTDEGTQWTVMAKLERPSRNGLYAMASYLYGDARSVNDGTSSQAASNWGNAYTQGDPNNVPLGRSRFSPGHRIIGAVSYDWKFGRRANLLSSLFYNGQSGRPYSIIVNGDWNGDGRTSNDLLYVPLANDPLVRVTGGTADQLNAWIEGDKGLSASRGRIMERGASRGPWTSSVDFRAAFGVNAASMKFEITFDMFNMLNLFNKDWGVIDFATFNDLNPIRVSLDPATNQMVYDISTLASPTYVKFDRDDLRSRWQGQLGLRVRF